MMGADLALWFGFYVALSAVSIQSHPRHIIFENTFGANPGYPPATPPRPRWKEHRVRPSGAVCVQLGCVVG